MLRNFNFRNKWSVPSGHRGGGLVLLWKDDIRVSVEDSSKYCIDTLVEKNTPQEWRFTGFYGEPVTHRRSEAWIKLRTLNDKPHIPWLCEVDFNEITRQEEKRGGERRENSQMQDFRDVIDECGFMDLGFISPNFTWAKHYNDGHSIWERLDHGLASNPWFLWFPGTKVHHLPCLSSDHCPLFINPSGIEIPSYKKPFRFEEMWLSDSGCGEVVEAAWRSCVSLDPTKEILGKIEKCGNDLTWWNYNVFGNVRRELKKKRDMLIEEEAVALRTGSNVRIRELQGEINELMDRETRMWNQRSRILWLKNGDGNTKFFHSRASHRYRKNVIMGLNDSHGVWKEGSDEVAAVLIDYYKELFTTSSPATHHEALNHIPQVITDDMNNVLTSKFEEWEVLKALKQMAPMKAPGPYGMPPLFFQHFWPMIEGDVTLLVLSWLNSGTIPHPLNHTFITLIPKKKNPSLVSNYHPISLCNVPYKIFAKVLANRLKIFLNFVINKNQSAFAKGRLISNNILIAFETLHCIKNYNSSASGFMVLKLDMSKAYDRVEWVFLENVMRKMGFSERWIGLIMVCVRSVTYSILVNGEPKEEIQPSRGLRQGDPLSPFLFLLCTEGLHGLINKATNNGDIHGFSLCKRGPKLTHLFFADDSLLFCRANSEECNKVLELLSVYEEVSGQKLNREKTALFFSNAVTEANSQIIKGIFGGP